MCRSLFINLTKHQWPRKPQLNSVLRGSSQCRPYWLHELPRQFPVVGPQSVRAFSHDGLPEQQDNAVRTHQFNTEYNKAFEKKFNEARRASDRTDANGNVVLTLDERADLAALYKENGKDKSELQAKRAVSVSLYKHNQTPAAKKAVAEKQRERYRNMDPVEHEKHLEQQRERYQNMDPKEREKHLEQRRERYQNMDRKEREKHLEQRRERYQNMDPEQREKRLEQQRERHQNMDPEEREKHLKQRRERYQNKDPKERV
jgi:hypothetical protein